MKFKDNIIIHNFQTKFKINNYLCIINQLNLGRYEEKSHLFICMDDAAIYFWTIVHLSLEESVTGSGERPA